MKAKPKMPAATIDEYLAAVRDDQRAALEKLRRTIRVAVPKAQECISYQIPAFRLDGRFLLAFGAAAKHCSFYPGAFPLEAHKKELKGYDTSKGTIRFQAAKPLPAALVRKLVKARIAENLDRRRPPKGKKASAGLTGKRPPITDEVQAALSSLKQMSTRRDRENLARFGISAGNALGVSMSNIQALAKRLERSHDLAAALWGTGVYEARMLAAFVDQPERVTAAQMDRWAKDFDNWGICDTLCFALFDRTSHAWSKVTKWSGRREEFVKRAAFALLWGLTVHDKRAANDPFVNGLRLIERAAADERHWVKKAVNMALRAVGKRNPALNAAALAVAHRLADSARPAAAWVGRDALRELTSPSVTRRLGSRRRGTE